MKSKVFKTKKSAETFERVLQAANKLFLKKGYHKTTMRNISEESKLGLGSLYYYFRSKEEFIITFYEKVNEEVLHKYRSEMPEKIDLAEETARYLRIKIQYLKEYRDLLRVVMKEAIDPQSALNPLSKESSPALAMTTGLFEELIEHSDQAEAEAKDMAKMMWFMHIGVLLYWLHDKSANCEATDRVIDTLASLLHWSQRLSKIPGIGGLRKRILSHIHDLFVYKE